MVVADARPIYAAIADDLRSRIVRGELTVGDQVPTEEALCARYGVSRMTVRQALAVLVQAGYLRRKRGKGTFVSADKAERSASRLLGFQEDARARGLQTSTNVLRVLSRPAEPEERGLLDVAAGTDLLHIERLRSIEREPIGINHILVLPEHASSLHGVDFSGSLYALIRTALGERVTHADQRVEAVKADVEQARLLAIAVGDPLLRITRVTYLESRRLLGLTRTYYRGDRYYLSLSVDRDLGDEPSPSSSKGGESIRHDRTAFR